MSIAVTEVRKSYQYGVGSARVTSDLPAFGWKLMTIGRQGRGPEWNVAARRPVKFGKDPVVSDMEKRYFDEYEYMDGFISRRAIINIFLAVLFGLPSLFIAILYLLSGSVESIAAKTLAMDMNIKTFLCFAGTENTEKPINFLPEAVAGTCTLAFRFVMLAIGLICLVAVIANIVLYYLKKSDPLRFFPQSASRINDCLNRSKERLSYLKAQEMLAAPQKAPEVSYGAPIFGATTNRSADLPASVSAESVPADKGLPAYTSYRIPVSITVGDSKVMGTVRVPRGINMSANRQASATPASRKEEEKGKNE